MLQHQQEHHKPYGQNGVYHHNHKGPHHGAHQRAHNGHQRRDAHQRAHHGRIGKAEQQHAKPTQRAQNTGLDTLPRHKFGKCARRHLAHMGQRVAGALRQKCLPQHNKLVFELFFSKQDIQSKNESDDGVGGAAGNAGYHMHRAAQQVARAGGYIAKQGLANAVPVDLRGRQPILQSGEGVPIGQKPGLRIFQKNGNLVCQHAKCIHQLGHHQHHHCGENGQNKHQRNQNTHGPAQGVQCFFIGFRPEFFFQRPHGHIQHKGNAKAQKERKRQPGAQAHRIPQQLPMVQRPVEQNGAEQNKRKRAHRTLFQLQTVSPHIPRAAAPALWPFCAPGGRLYVNTFILTGFPCPFKQSAE